MELSSVAFILLGVLSIVMCGLLISRRWPVSSAMMLITVFVLLAGMYGILDAHFAAVTQIIVYAGAIMVVFVFVMMLLNLPPEELRYGGVTFGEWFIIGISFVAVVFLGTEVGRGTLADGVNMMLPEPNSARRLLVPINELGNVQGIAASMFTDYLWAFELISFLILTSIIGAIVIAKKRGQDAQST